METLVLSAELKTLQYSQVFGYCLQLASLPGCSSPLVAGRFRIQQPSRGPCHLLPNLHFLLPNMHFWWWESPLLLHNSTQKPLLLQNEKLLPQNEPIIATKKIIDYKIFFIIDYKKIFFLKWNFFPKWNFFSKWNFFPKWNFFSKWFFETITTLPLIYIILMKNLFRNHT